MTAMPPPRDSAPDAIHVGDLTIDRDRFLVTVSGTPVPVTYTEFRALHLIASAGGRVASYDELGEALWGESGPQTRRRLAVVISRIRSKLGSAGDCIDTVYRVGYRLTQAPRPPAQHPA